MPEPFPSEFAGPEDSAGFLLWQVGNLWQRKQKAALECVGLTHVQFVLLASLNWLTHNGEIVTQIELARQAKTDAMMTSQVVRALEKRGLVQRTEHPFDSRAKCLRLTSAGRKRVVRAMPLVEGVDAEFFATLGSRLAPFRKSLVALNRVEATAPPE